jgi:hypothetical protein
MHPTLILVVASAAIALATSSPAVSQSDAIGLATRVDNQVSGTIAGQTSNVTTGTKVYQLEVIHTNGFGRAQLSFLDSTVLSIGPSSEVNLDRFVYDPDKTTGDVVLNLGKGTFRFITGSQDKRNYKIVSPVATIGVRGTIFHVQYTDTELTVVLQEGAVTVTLPNGTVITLDQPGQAVTILIDGTVVGPYRYAQDATDPFGIGWQQFADNGNPQTTGSTTTFPFTFGPGGDVPVVVSTVPCVTPTCN